MTSCASVSLALSTPPPLQVRRMAVVAACIVLRREGKGTGQIDRVPAAADVPVAIEKKLNSPRCQARFSSPRCDWVRRRVCRAIAIASCCCHSTTVQAVECMTRAASPHTHLALPTSSAPCLPDSDATTIRNLQDFTAADNLASRLITGGSATLTQALILPPGNALFNGYLDAGYPLTALRINNPTFDTDHRHRDGMLTKTPPTTELQIPASVTILLGLAHLQTPKSWRCLHY